MHVIKRHEYEADEHAVLHDHGPSIKSALIQKSKTNKGPLVADSIYSAMCNSHPTLTERLEAIDRAIKDHF